MIFTSLKKLEIYFTENYNIEIFLQLMRQGGLEVIDCNNHVKSAIKYFGPSCAVNSLTDRYNPLGDNSDQLCKLCIGEIPGGRCTTADPYADYEGAFRCLLEVGDIAFLFHTTVLEMTSTNFDLSTFNSFRRCLSKNSLMINLSDLIIFFCRFRYERSVRAALSRWNACSR